MLNIAMISVSTLHFEHLIVEIQSKFEQFANVWTLWTNKASEWRLRESAFSSTCSLNCDINLNDFVFITLLNVIWEWFVYFNWRFFLLKVENLWIVVSSSLSGEICPSNLNIVQLGNVLQTTQLSKKFVVFETTQNLLNAFHFPIKMS